MSPSHQELLDAYILDYLQKQNLHISAWSFQAEADVQTSSVDIDDPNGFLLQFWSSFRDVYAVVVEKKRLEEAATAAQSEGQQIEDREQHLHELYQKSIEPLLQEQQHMQNILLEDAGAATGGQPTWLPFTQTMPGAPSSVLQGNPQNFQNWHQQYLGSGQENIFLEDAVAISDGQSTWQTLPEAPSCVLQENFQNFQNQNQQHLEFRQENIFLDDAGVITDGQPTWQTLFEAPSGVLQEHFQNFQNQKQQHLVSEQQNIFLEDAGAINGGQLTWQTLYGAPSSGLQENFQNFQNKNQQYLVFGQIDMDGLVGDGSLCVSDSVLEGFTLEEIQLIVEFEKMDCCHFSPDGKLLAMGGHNKLVSLYSTSSNWPVPFEFSLLVGVHYDWITDVRFSPSMPRIIATSSADKNVNIWDVDSPHVPRYSFTDHSETVLTLDFHPGKEDLLFSSDYRVIRCWNISDADGECTLSSRPSKLGINQIRFEPSTGKYLAVAANNFIIILDGETLVDKDYFKGHIKDVHSVCWHSSGEFLASVSDDSVRVWRVSEGKCVYKLETNGKKFNTCVFHPSHDCLLIIGCHKTFEIWHFLQNKLISMPAHGDLVSCLAVSNVTGFVASASHDKHVKLWK